MYYIHFANTKKLYAINAIIYEIRNWFTITCNAVFVPYSFLIIEIVATHGVYNKINIIKLIAEDVVNSVLTNVYIFILLKMLKVLKTASLAVNPNNQRYNYSPIFKSEQEQRTEIFFLPNMLRYFSPLQNNSNLCLKPL